MLLSRYIDKRGGSDMDKNSNLTKLQKGYLKFDRLISNILAPKILRPSEKDFKENKLRYFAKCAATVCCTVAVGAAAFTIAPVPTALVAASVAMGRAYASKGRSEVTQVSHVAVPHKPPMKREKFEELSRSPINNRSNSNGGSSKESPTAEFLSKFSGKSNG